MAPDLEGWRQLAIETLTNLDDTVVLGADGGQAAHEFRVFRDQV